MKYLFSLKSGSKSKRISVLLKQKFQGDELGMNKARRARLNKIFLVATTLFISGCICYINRKSILIVSSKVSSTLFKSSTRGSNPQNIEKIKINPSNSKVKIAATVLLVLAGTILLANQGNLTGSEISTRAIQSQVPKQDYDIGPGDIYSLPALLLWPIFPRLWQLVF